MRQSTHGPDPRTVHCPDTVQVHIDRDARQDVRETAGSEHLIISKFPVRQSRSRKSRLQRWLALVRQSTSQNQEKFPWRSQPLGLRRSVAHIGRGCLREEGPQKANRRQLQSKKILYGIFAPKQILKNRRFQDSISHQKSRIISFSFRTSGKAPFSKILRPFCSFFAHPG